MKCTFLINVLWFAGVQHYNEIKDISICEFLPPHLVIYVDQPAQEVQKKLKQSGKVVRNSLTRLLGLQYASVVCFVQLMALYFICKWNNNLIKTKTTSPQRNVHIVTGWYNVRCFNEAL